MFLIKNENDLVTECSYLENDITQFCLEFQNLSLDK